MLLCVIMIEILPFHRVDYQSTWDLQLAIQGQIIQEKLRQRQNAAIHRSPDALLLVEHPHVYTLGKSGNAKNLLSSSEQLKEVGAKFIKIDRGGDITYHGPGQMVGYPILDLDRHFTDIHKYLRLLEETIIRMLFDFGIQAGRKEKLTGVWVGEEKICAMGVKCSRWVTIHGFALNVNTDLNYFGNIIPCGIQDKGVCSMQTLLGEAPDRRELMKMLCKHFSELFEVPVRDSLQWKSFVEGFSYFQNKWFDFSLTPSEQTEV